MKNTVKCGYLTLSEKESEKGKIHIHEYYDKKADAHFMCKTSRKSEFSYFVVPMFIHRL